MQCNSAWIWILKKHTYRQKKVSGSDVPHHTTLLQTESWKTVKVYKKEKIEPILD